MAKNSNRFYGTGRRRIHCPGLRGCQGAAGSKRSHYDRSRGRPWYFADRLAGDGQNHAGKEDSDHPACHDADGAAGNFNDLFRCGEIERKHADHAATAVS